MFYELCCLIVVVTGVVIIALVNYKKEHHNQNNELDELKYLLSLYNTGKEAVLIDDMYNRSTIDK